MASIKTQEVEGVVTKLKKLKINGKWNGSTRVALQAYLSSNGYNVDIDGYFQQQSIKALQKHLKVDIDGSWGSQTTTALQKFLNTKGVSGKIDVDGQRGNETIAALQVYLNTTIPN